MTLVHKTVSSNLKIVNFFAECDAGEREQLDVDAITSEDNFSATIMLDVAGGPGQVTLELSEQGIDDLRSVLYAVSNQLMFNRGRRDRDNQG